MLEYRDGTRLDQIWNTLSENEKAYIQSQCLRGITTLRQMNVHMHDAGMHNVPCCKESGLLTLLDFESAVEVETLEVPLAHEMGAIFCSDLLIGRFSGG